MGLIDFLNKDEETNKERNDRIFKSEAENLGMTKEEIEDMELSGISPEEWLEADGE